MKVDNPLSREFLQSYPAESARCLEQVSVEHVAALFTELPPQQVVPVMSSMLPAMAATCLGLMPTAIAAGLVSALPVSSAARIYRMLVPAKQDELSAHLADESRERLHHYMVYPSESAGALLDSNIDVLPQNVSVAEALRRIERLEHTVNCEIYVVDDAHHLAGVIDLGSLLSADHQTHLRDIMKRKAQPVSVHASAESLLLHPGWATHRRLPVVERDNTLVGVLEHNLLRDSVSEIESAHSRDPLENMLSLASLYWLSMAQLMDGILSIARADKGESS